MLKRKIDADLSKWAHKPGKKCLLVRGARQIGKTTSVRILGEQYTSFIEINFLKSPSLMRIFSGDLDVDTLLMNFSVYLARAKFIPGQTLLFLDEIQECPQAMTSLKFWCEDGRFDIIASGSLLGIDYNRPKSYPVGFIDYLDMTALSFEEFLWACGISKDVIQKLEQSFLARQKVSDALNDRVMQLLRVYMTVGGMPEAITTYFEHNSLYDCYEKQQSILKDYRYDIAHYAPADIKIKAEKCFFSLSRQLSKENRKFKYSFVEKGGNARKFGTSIDWLLGAYLIVLSHNVNKLAIPLDNYMDEVNFRVYPTDIGLLTAMFDYKVKKDILEDSFDKEYGYVRGGLYEALIADMLYKNGRDYLFFQKNAQATFEIEFLIETEDGIIPVEIKSKNSRSRSLDNLLKKPEIPYGYKLVGGNVGVCEKKITLPLYMAMFL